MNIKMKQIGLLLLLLITTSLQAQIQKISELSQNKFLDAEIIYEENGEDVWGYFLLYKADMVSRDFLKLEYIILDKNLNKVGSNTFNQDCYDSWLVDIMPTINSVYKNKNELLFAIGFDYDEMYTKSPYAFRKINLNDFSIGNSFMFIDNKLIEDNKIMDRLIAEKKEPAYFSPIKNHGFLSVDSKNAKYRSRENSITFSKQNKNLIGYSYFDLNFNKLWTFAFIPNEKTSETHLCLNSNSDVVVFYNEYKGKIYDNLNNKFYKVVDIKNGNELALIPLNDDKYIYQCSKMVFDKDKIIFFDKIYEKNKKGYIYSDKCLGYSKRVYDIKNNSVIDQKFLFWENISRFKEITKYGEVNKWDYIQFLDFKITSDGNTLIIGEGYEPSGSTKIKNLYTLELDSEFNLTNFQEILKNVNKYGEPNLWGETLDNYNLFDFMYSQKIKNDEFIYFYQDNEKGKKNKIWTLGAIVYADGKFSNQKIDLKTENGIINPIKAKKGYIILQEVNDRGENTIRLEKIDY